jgi:hypothetical protein
VEHAEDNNMGRSGNTNYIVDRNWADVMYSQAGGEGVPCASEEKKKRKSSNEARCFLGTRGQ